VREILFVPATNEHHSVTHSKLCSVRSRCNFSAVGLGDTVYAIGGSVTTAELIGGLWSHQ
jgi:hypothetical protein